MRRKRKTFLDSVNFWPCVSDMMLAAFIFVLLLWMTERIQNMWAPVELSQLKEELHAANTRLSAAQARVDHYEKDANQRSAETKKSPANLLLQKDELIAQLRAENARLNDQPPVIDMPESQGFRFDSGKAELTADFDRMLTATVLPKLRESCAKYRDRVDTIEIIGHTDGKPVADSRNSNLDALLGKALLEQAPLGALNFSSNTELGFIRAVAVAKRLRQAQQQQQLPLLDVRSYSAAQLVEPAGLAHLSAQEADSARRRIEIRLTRLKTASSPDLKSP